MQSNPFWAIIAPWGLGIAPWNGKLGELPREEAGQGLTTRSRPTTPAWEQDMPESSNLHGAGGGTGTNLVQNPQNLYSVQGFYSRDLHNLHHSICFCVILQHHLLWTLLSLCRTKADRCLEKRHLNLCFNVFPLGAMKRKRSLLV